MLRGSIFVFDAASCPDSYSSVSSFSSLIYLYVCAPLVVQLHLLSLIGSSHDNHSGLGFVPFFLTMACAVVITVLFCKEVHSHKLFIP